MSIESAKAFIERMKADEDFAKKVKECESAESRMSFVKEAGYDFTVEEFKEVQLELTDEEIDNVASGGFAYCMVLFYYSAK